MVGFFNPQNLMVDRLPPQALDVEEVVLGALLMESTAFKKVAQILTPETFYKEDHQSIYRAIYELNNEGKPIDIITVPAQMAKTNDFDPMGGSLMIAKLTNRVAGAGNITEHALILKDKYLRREVMRKAHEASELAYRDDVETSEILSRLNKDAESVNKIAVVEKKSPDIQSAIKESLDNYEERIKRKQANKSNGVPTGFKGLDDLTYGLQNTDYIIWAGRPSAGKTATALFSMRKQAESGFKPGIISIEMARDKLVDRLIISDESIDVDAFRKGNISEADRVDKSAAKLNKLKIYIDDETTNIDGICTTAIAWREKYGIDILYIDYIGLIESHTKISATRENQVSEISRRLKKLAKEAGIPVVALSQLNRANSSRGDKRPQLSDLRESGSLEQDADLVVFIHRPEYYGDTDEANVVELIVAKHRNGAIGTVRSIRNETHTNYRDENDEFISNSSEDIPSPFPSDVF